jgi:hypothetical protein
MTMIPTRMRRIFAASACLLIAALACGKNKPTQPQTPLATIQSIWPNEDGRAWTYSLIVEEWQDTSSIGIFQNVADVPPAPSLVSLQARFASLAKGDSATADTGSMTLRFTGQVTTTSGVTAQNLLQTIGPPVSPGLRGSVYSRSVAGSAPLLAQLRRARLDLSRIGAQFGVAGVPSGGLRFLFGGAWRKTSSAILHYGDLDTFPDWEYLRADLVPGAEFSRALIPTLTDDVILHGRVVGRKTVVTPFGTFADAIECFYLVDYGVNALTDNQGQPIGYVRDIACGTVSYVDSLGPVASSERAHLRVGRNGQFSNGGGGGSARLTAHLPPIAPPLLARRR